MSRQSSSSLLTALLVSFQTEVFGIWDPDWGGPVVISPLEVVPKKRNTFRLILDLSKMNKYLSFPRFKYAYINQTRDVFEPGDFLFAWDLKDGYN